MTKSPVFDDGLVGLETESRMQVNYNIVLCECEELVFHMITCPNF